MVDVDPKTNIWTVHWQICYRAAVTYPPAVQMFSITARRRFDSLFFSDLTLKQTQLSCRQNKARPTVETVWPVNAPRTAGSAST